MFPDKEIWQKWPQTLKPGVPFCVEFYCSPPVSIRNSNILSNFTSQNIPVGSISSNECDFGYFLEDSVSDGEYEQNSICQNNSNPQWSELLSCVEGIRISHCCRDLSFTLSPLTLSFSHCFTLSLSHSLTSLIFSLCHTHSHSPMLSFPRYRTLSVAISLSQSLTLSYSHSLTLSLSQFLTLSYSHSVTLSLSRSLTVSHSSHFLSCHTHSQSRMLSLSHTLRRSLVLAVFRTLTLPIAHSDSITLWFSHSLTLSLNHSHSLMYLSLCVSLTHVSRTLPLSFSQLSNSLTITLLYPVATCCNSLELVTPTSHTYSSYGVQWQLVILQVGTAAVKSGFNFVFFGFRGFSLCSAPRDRSR